MTISPSIDFMHHFERIKILKNEGIIPALGHDRQCTEEQIIAALTVLDGSDQKEHRKYSSLHMTHCFNVQKFHHRNVGLANFALTPTLPKYRQI